MGGDDESGSSPEQQFALLGGALCLDFANTADWHAGDAPVELLTGYDALLAWGRDTGILDDRQAHWLADEAERSPDAAAATLRRAVILREAIYRLFAALAAAEEPDAADLATINAELADALPHRQLARGDGNRFDWAWQGGGLDCLLWPVALSAAELLISDDLGRVRQCAGHPCGWLFIDASRNRSRRWCSMESCGNRAKARRHYQRARSGSATNDR